MFYNCSKLKSITLPSSVTTINNSAFQTTGLTSISIPVKVTSIGLQAFYSCSNLKTVTIEDGTGALGFSRSIRHLKNYIVAILADFNDINEDTRIQHELTFHRPTH